MTGKFSWVVTLPIALIAMVAISFAMLAVLPQHEVHAAEDEICRVALALDRSGSLGETDGGATAPTFASKMKDQVGFLFTQDVNRGIYDPNVLIGFWTFSSGVRQADGSYDLPSYKYVSSQGINSGFDAALQGVTPGGGTNYEQGFGYDAGVPNPNSNIRTLIDNADILVFLTDGDPNTPGGSKATAIPPARAAVQKLRAEAEKRPGRELVIIGLAVNNEYTETNLNSLQQVINGTVVIPVSKVKDTYNYTKDNYQSFKNQPNVFSVQKDYGNLAATIKRYVTPICKSITVPPEPYSTEPIVTSSDSAVTSGSTVTLDYSAVNTIKKGTTPPLGWSIKKVVVQPGQSISPISGSHNNYSCAKVIASLGNKATCADADPAAHGTQVFSHSSIPQTIQNVPEGARTLTIDDTWPIGTKLCLILVIDYPTQNANPSNIYSKAYCFSLGKRPLIQIRGGDLRVGGYFLGETDDSSDGAPLSADEANPSTVESSTAVDTEGNLYGSWAEYGVTAPGVVKGFASMSGLEDGFPGGAGSLAATQALWSKLTFANTDNEFGLFSQNKKVVGSIPDTARAVLDGHSVVKDLSADDHIDFNGPDVKSGTYAKNTGSITLNASHLERGRTVVLYAPLGTVTVTGNVTYDNGPYTDMKDIPQLVVIANRINIDPSVSYFDGWLIANGTDGTITTCDDARVLTISRCNGMLQINGPVMARHLELRRTAGSSSGSAAGDPAEVINLPGTSFLWTQSEGKSDMRVQTVHTIELPPYF